MQSLLKKQYPELANETLTHDFYFAHRLDFATSGILLIPLNRTTCAEVCDQFEHCRISKYYLALVRGHVEREYDIIDLPIGEDVRFKDTSKKMCAATEKSFCVHPRRSLTKLLVLQKGFYNNKPVTKLLLKPQTGRRHQLRLHCSEIGHHIVGDYTYSSKSDISPPRMFLHAFRIILPNSIENLDIQTEGKQKNLKIIQFTK